MSSLLTLVHNAHLHTEDRALRSGKSTKQNAHKRVLALYIQPLMNTTFVLIKKKKKKKKKQYKGGLEPGTSKLFDKISTYILLTNTSRQSKFIRLVTAVKTLGISYILLLIFLQILILSSSPGVRLRCGQAHVCSGPTPPHLAQCGSTLCSYATKREHDQWSTSNPPKFKPKLRPCIYKYQ